MTNSKPSSADKEAFHSHVDKVNWEKVETAYGSADKIANLLVSFRYGSIEEAANAGHVLWCSLCHQHAYVSSAALPAAPFIAEVLNRRETWLIENALDILVGFMVCTGTDSDQQWMQDLRAYVVSLSPRIEPLVSRTDGDVAEFAMWLLDLIAKGSRG